MKKAIVTFCGHRDYRNGDLYFTYNIEDVLEREILNLFNEYDYITFYLGDEGIFDNTIREIIVRLKAQKNLPCEMAYVMPYLQPYPNLENRFDYSVYPPLETVPKKYCISRRNNWMAERADVLISFVCKGWGGPWNMLDYAQSRLKNYGKPKIINIAKQ